MCYWYDFPRLLPQNCVHHNERKANLEPRKGVQASGLCTYTFRTPSISLYSHTRRTKKICIQKARRKMLSGSCYFRETTLCKQIRPDYGRFPLFFVYMRINQIPIRWWGWWFGLVVRNWRPSNNMTTNIKIVIIFFLPKFNCFWA